MNQPMDFEIPATVRDLASKSVDQAREAYNRFLEAARQAHDVVTKSTDVITNGAREINEKAVRYTEANLQANFELASVSFTQKTSKRSSTFRASLRAGRWRHSRIRLRNSPALWRNRRRRPLPRASTNNAVVSPPVADSVLVQRRFRRRRNQAARSLSE